MLFLTIAVAASSLWDGDFFDPDELKITLQRSGDDLLAHSSDWDISGSIIGDTTAHLAGLEGVLSNAGVTWSNGVVWTRHALPSVLPPPTWGGTYRAKTNGIDVTLSLPNPTTARASSNSFGTPAMGHVSGDTISMFGVRGKLRAGYALDGGVNNVIDWANGEVWTKTVSTGPTEHLKRASPPPPLLAAGTPGAAPDYWAADFAAAAHAPPDAAAAFLAVGGPGSRGPAMYANQSPRTPGSAMGGTAGGAVRAYSYGEVGGQPTGQLATLHAPADVAKSSTPASSSVDGEGGGGGGVGVVGWALGLLALMCAGLAARSYQRHGTVQPALLRDDARELFVTIRHHGLLNALRSRGGRAPAGSARLATNDESVEGWHEDAREGAEGAGWVGAVQARLPARAAELLGAFTASVSAAYAAKPVASAAEDGVGTEINWGGGEEEEEGGDEGGAPRGLDEAPPTRGYDWGEGPKLSWEVGASLPPTKLPDYDREIGEEC